MDKIERIKARIARDNAHMEEIAQEINELNSLRIELVENIALGEELVELLEGKEALYAQHELTQGGIVGLGEIRNY